MSGPRLIPDRPRSDEDWTELAWLVDCPELSCPHVLPECPWQGEHPAEDGDG